MKLKTEMVDGDVFARGKSSLDKLRRLRHDAMAAHALLQAMVDCRKRYSSLEYAADQTAEHYLQSTLERAAEILDGWMGEDRG